MIRALLVLQQRGTVTAAELADELEVSDRTARRVLESLSVAGIPVYSRAGRGGGWALVGGARTDLSGLTASEAQALFQVAGPNVTGSPELRDALRKLVSALPATFRDAAEAAADSTVIDPALWGDRRVRRVEPFLEPLRSAVIDGVQVTIEYVNRGQVGSSRTISPLGIVDKRGVSYLIAGTDDGQRTFRVDRVRSIERSDQPVVRPADFDLSAAWTQSSQSFEADWPTCIADVRVDPQWWPVLGFFMDGRVERLGTDERGWIIALVEGRGIDGSVARLAGFAGKVDVVGPPELCDALAALGRALVDQYERGPGTGQAIVSRRRGDHSGAGAGGIR